MFQKINCNYLIAWLYKVVEMAEIYYVAEQRAEYIVEKLGLANRKSDPKALKELDEYYKQDA